MVREPVLVEPVGTHVGLGRVQVQLLPGHEPEQVPLGPAVRAVALDHLTDLAIDIESDPAAMASASISHAFAPPEGAAIIAQAAPMARKRSLNGAAGAVRPCPGALATSCDRRCGHSTPPPLRALHGLPSAIRRNPCIRR